MSYESIPAQPNGASPNLCFRVKRIAQYSSQGNALRTFSLLYLSNSLCVPFNTNLRRVCSLSDIGLNWMNN